MKPLHELDALCAEHVAGCVPCDNWKLFMHDNHNGQMLLIDDSCGHTNCVPRSMWPPKYSENPAAVIALLEKHFTQINRYTDTSWDDGPCWHVTVHVGNLSGSVRAPTFALAATLALLKAHGAETE